MRIHPERDQEFYEALRSVNGAMTVEDMVTFSAAVADLPVPAEPVPAEPEAVAVPVMEEAVEGPVKQTRSRPVTGPVTGPVDQPATPDAAPQNPDKTEA